ncbi:MAG: hypothetical protein H8K06_13070 [Nitrospira sp.]|uniref:Lipoprotein n=1 Tax=Nitrospira defluvii TaxID=330214 RepID=A0ABM8QQM6_9BACT|nr:hypothetical protein [Nitrospira defluvii]MCS6328001.1 hypothetical protein [Nitrospira sp.]CAE6710095.1 conserved exported hypothetical protein [Nitrospira defluvii]
MRQVVVAFGMGCVVMMLQGCAAPAKQIGHEPAAFADGNRVALSDDDVLKKMERHVERQDRPGSTLMFR